MGQEGDYDFNTDKSVNYREHEYSRPERAKAGQDNLRPEGQQEKETENTREYNRKYADRSQAVRPGSNLGQAGSQDFRTDKNESKFRL